MAETADLPRRVLDELEIRRQIGLFADAAMSGDLAAFASLFTEDGEFVIGSPADMRAEGREAIAAMLAQLREGQDFFVQHIHSNAIIIEGDRATVRSLVYEMARGPGEHYYRNEGMFFDKLVRSGDSWLFASRRYGYFWLDTSPFAGSSFSQPAVFAQHSA